LPRATTAFKTYAEQLKDAYRNSLEKKVQDDLGKIKGASTVDEIVDLFLSNLEGKSTSKIVKIMDPLSACPIRILPPIDELLSLPIINRLRSIRQLSFSFLSYPSANHTRFEHSVGVYNLAQKLLDHPLVKKIMDEETSKAFLVAALIHDIGQGPGSHSIEKLFQAKYDEVNATRFVNSPDFKKFGIAKILDGGLRDKVLKILPGGPPLEPRDKLCSFLRESLNSEIDIDRLDFLNRDPYFCGVLTGRIDPLHILEYVNPFESDQGYRYSFSDDPHAFEFINGAISSRSELYPLIYQDEKRMAADEAFCHAFFAFSESWSPGKYEKLANKMIFLNDHQILTLMQAFGDTYVRSFASYVLNGDIPYVKAYETKIGREESVQFQFWYQLWGKPFDLIALLECAFCDLFEIPKCDNEPGFFIHYPLREPKREVKKKEVLINTKEHKLKDIRDFSETAEALLDGVIPTYNKLFFFASTEFSGKVSRVLGKIFTEEAVGKSFLHEIENIITPKGKIPEMGKAQFSEDFRKVIFA
jgi:HD superfamily phosphohydrolase